MKAALAVQLNPNDSSKAAEHIQKSEGEFLSLDPNAAARQKISEVIEMVKMIDKHGGPKQA